MSTSLRDQLNSLPIKTHEHWEEEAVAKATSQNSDFANNVVVLNSLNMGSVTLKSYYKTYIVDEMFTPEQSILPEDLPVKWVSIAAHEFWGHLRFNLPENKTACLNTMFTSAGMVYIEPADLRYLVDRQKEINGGDLELSFFQTRTRKKSPETGKPYGPSYMSMGKVRHTQTLEVKVYNPATKD